MPMGIVSDEDFQKERDKHVSRDIRPPVPSATVIDSPTKGRGEGNVEVPDALRKVIGETAITDGRQDAVALARSFGISPSSASAYANGSTSTATYDERPNSKVIDGTKLRVQRRARAKLMMALKGITPEKIEATKARDLAGIAKDMAAVVQQMEPESDNSKNKGNTGPTFIFYSPQQRKEESFDVVYPKD